MNDQKHYDGCWEMPGHHECAKALVERLATELSNIQKETAVLEADIKYWRRHHDLVRADYEKHLRMNGL